MTQNKSNIPQKAFILAAGFGTRLRPYTDERPKPMVEINGRSLIWRILDKLRAVGVQEVVVNMHYLADVLGAHLKEYAAMHPDFILHLSHEPDILDTGGGVKNALSYFGDEPFYVIAGDALWTDPKEGACALERLAQNWNPKTMDILTLFQPLSRMVLTAGVGDYDLMEDGLVKRAPDKNGAYMFTNIRINTPRIYQTIEDTKFSFLPVMDDCESAGRFYALEHDADWHHISTPQDLEAVDVYFREHETQGEG